MNVKKIKSMEGNEFSRISLLYQAMTNKYKRYNLLEQYSVLVEKEQWGDFLRGWLL